MRRIWLGLAAAGMVVTQPLAAQNTGREAKQVEDGEVAIAEMMKTLFKVEPLTAEQQARLPQAQAVIARMMPPGTMQQVMGGMYEKFLGPMMAMAGEASSADIAAELGADADDIDLDKDEAAQIAALLDPAWKERRELEAAALQRAMTAAMTAMEPGMRKGMAEAYAASFTTAELTDIDSFFATPSGASFARKSYTLASDPRIMSAAMEGLPAMMGQMKAMEAEAKAATARLPARRGYADLTPAQRALITKLTGLDADAIQEGMERVAAERLEKETTEGDPEAEAATVEPDADPES